MIDLADLIPAFVAVPAGPFLMGTPVTQLSELAMRYGGTRESYREEAPRHTLELAAFGIAVTPVTNALYAAYVAATDARAPVLWRGPSPPASLLHHPVVDVNWHEVLAFCAWLSSQRPGPPLRLPSEAEWERAARGSDGRTFPWGEHFEPRYANTRESAAAGTTAVTSYAEGASPVGVLGMAGNVWEWTLTLDAPYPYQPTDGREALDAPGRRIMRGGCYANPHGFARCACRFRLAPDVRNEFTGFRLAYTSSV
ncbi:MAG: formylglycine-generating enzyme family protein [Candidatus Viridilinea halotolerans]|uniref:Formylglycine-generating enzyme family protein n=1 Tax=Candidatus Viridilinea halotolerans TaxID=2491704 RepID=A0A426U6V5_9CHLR|nr:MAG: formylglycine-generating enzyme family protein [Candidatus Viridilinea halotolerans]